MSETIRIALWNIEWAARVSARGKEIRRLLVETAPDIICLTEASAGFLGEHHQIDADPDFGYPNKADYRKVLLWSRWKWLTSRNVGDSAMPTGRYIEGTIATPIGELRIVGACIPWSAAHVSTGRRNRVRWEDHMAYVTGLGELAAGWHDRTIILGDFNQTIPRSRQPLQVAQALSAALSLSFVIATAGQMDANGSSAIDHLAHTRDLQANVIGILPATTPQGLRLSDHFGLVLEASIHEL